MQIAADSLLNDSTGNFPSSSSKHHLQQLTDDDSEFVVPSLSFRCEWKEVGLFERNRQCFGLTIFFSPDEERTFLIRFDGNDSEWQHYDLEGPYGRVSRHDLVIGSRIKLMGRTITVTHATSAAVRWIDKELQKLCRQQDFLHSKIKSVGKIAVVKTTHWEPLFDIKRQHKGTRGKVDLRKLLVENNQLCAQLESLGLGHFAVVSKSLSSSTATYSGSNSNSITSTLRNKKQS